MISGNLLHRIDQKKEKQSDFKDEVAATFVFNQRTFYKVTTSFLLIDS